MKRNAYKHLSWDNFQSSVFVTGEERVHRISEEPIIEVFGDGIRHRIGVWLQVPADAAIPEVVRKLVVIQACLLERKANRKQHVLLEVSTSTPSILRHFYHFAVAVAERMLVDNTPSISAVLAELQCFADFLEEKPLLGIERQVGLIGELIVLDRLVNKVGPDGLLAWIGPQREPHDFRISNAEYEVKTTVRAERIHTIHGVQQLVPTKGCKLFLISVLVGSAGKGDCFSLAGLVRRLSTQFAAAPQRLQQFLAFLEASGYVEADENHYTRSFVLRRPLAVVPVNEHFPAVTRKVISEALGSDRSSRITALQYDVNVEGMEIEDGKKGFPQDI